MVEQFNCKNCEVSSKETNQQSIFECDGCGLTFAKYKSVDAFKVEEQKVNTCLINGEKFIAVLDKKQLRSLAQDDILTFPDKVNAGIGIFDIVSGVVKLLK